ncbi:YveK family protein [Streptosporangium sp. NPDC000396]|uniref:YveK family protein n=1 Tax=Streptosporangium sp. NPDC000396 TaxID=3366185 RepID=UPI003692C241
MSLSPGAPTHLPGGDLADYGSFLRRRWPIILFFLALGIGGGVALLRAAPLAYTASAQVLVSATGLPEQTNQVTNRQRESLNLDTEAQIAQSAVVAKKVQAALKSTPGPVEVSVPPNTSVLEISYTATDPNTAAAGASAYAQAYLAHRSESSTQALEAQLKTLLAKLKQVNASLGSVAATLPGLAKGTAERTIALQRQNVLSRQVYNLTIKYDTLKTIVVTPGSVISDAIAPSEPSSPSPPLYLGSGFMAGLLAGIGLAWLRDRLGTRLHDSADVKRLTGLDIVSGEEIDDLTGSGGAVLLVPLPGTSSRDVAQAVRHLNERSVPVLGAVVATAPAQRPATGETALSS